MLDIFNVEDNECLFCDGVCTCVQQPIINDDAWQCDLHPGSPVEVKQLKDLENVWCVIISNDKFNESVVLFHKHSGRHTDIKWNNLTPLGKYKK